MGGILFISSHHTGQGHRSITEALKEQLLALSPQVEINEVDGFMLGGKVSGTMSGLYNKVAVSLPIFWKLCYAMGDIFTSWINFFATRNLRKGLLKCIREFQPGAIVVVHPGFVTPTIDALKVLGLKVPVAVMVADLDNVTRLWADPRAQVFLCPSENSRNMMLNFGISDENIKVFGFPTRQRFNDVKPLDEADVAQLYDEKRRLKFLLVNGSQGVGYSTRIARIILSTLDSEVIILAGKNQALKRTLENELLPEYNGRVTVCGFIENMEHYMSISDILIVRASPNVLMEAVNMLKPVIVSGALYGQEEKNPEFIMNNNLGVVCDDFRKLPEVIDALLEKDAKKLREIYSHQLLFRQPEAARETAKFLLELL